MARFRIISDKSSNKSFFYPIFDQFMSTILVSKPFKKMFNLSFKFFSQFLIYPVKTPFISSLILN